MRKSWVTMLKDYNEGLPLSVNAIPVKLYKFKIKSLHISINLYGSHSL